MRKIDWPLGFKRLSYVLLSVLFALPACAAADEGIFVKPVIGLQEDFIFAADVSSVISLENSGVVIRNQEGKPSDLFQELRKGGFTAVRVRIWNDPYDGEGHGYGGGNNDLQTAVELARRCRENGLGLMVDFHYSDFWADPAKQQCPKAWEGMEIQEKTQALYAFTVESLTALQDTGVDILQVQVGNETDNGIAGETNRMHMASLLNAGSKAVRDTLPTARVAVHFSKPDAQHAQTMRMFMVDYDVFGCSYYPYWHGSLENLFQTLQTVKEQYGKDTMVLETAYCYTEENGDFHPNSVPAIGTAHPFANTLQGQANALRAITQTASDAGALGLCYWEPAWLPVPGESVEEQASLWETHGSGWASSFAGTYDPDDAGAWYGGSSWDNQALFDFQGNPLPTLFFPRYAREGAQTVRAVDSYLAPEVQCFIDDGIALPETVEAVYNDGSVEPVPVEWNGEQVAKLLLDGLGEFQIDGTANETPVACHVTVTAENFLLNPGFEEVDMDMWQVTNLGTEELYRASSVNDIKSGSHLFHFFSEKNVEFRIEQTVTGLREGLYDFSLYLHGGDVQESNMYLYAIVDGKEYAAVPMKVTQWKDWQHPVIEKIPVSHGEITVGAYVYAQGSRPWGKLDDFMLNLSR